MMMFASLAVAALSANEIVRIPGGHDVPRGCITALPNNGIYEVDEASAPTGCDTAQRHVASPEVQIYAADVHQHVPSGKAGFTSFTADWTVPPLPSSHAGQVSCH